MEELMSEICNFLYNNKYFTLVTKYILSTCFATKESIIRERILDITKE